jgi:hypothetical protein
VKKQNAMKKEKAKALLLKKPTEDLTPVVGGATMVEYGVPVPQIELAVFKAFEALPPGAKQIVAANQVRTAKR